MMIIIIYLYNTLHGYEMDKCNEIYEHKQKQPSTT